MVYLDLVPVRLDTDGSLVQIGLLLRQPREGGVWRALVSGRVLLHDDPRGDSPAHREGPGADGPPRVPASPQPFTVSEYFPTARPTGYEDPRQHAVSLAYIVPVDGDAQAQADALQLTWLTPAEALEPAALAECASGHGNLVVAAVAHLGALP